MPDSVASALAEIQRLPTATRRQLVQRLAEHEAPELWCEEERFYQWLTDYYRQFGAEPIDAALSRIGGNNARRTLRQCLFDWANGNGLRLDPALSLELQVEALDEQNPYARTLSQLIGLISGSDDQNVASRSGVHGASPPLPVAELKNAQAVVDGAAQALARIVPAVADQSILQLVAGFASELNAKLDAAETRAKALAKEAAARKSLATALAALSPEHRDLLPLEVDGGSADEIAAAADVVCRLAATAEVEADAIRKVAESRSLEERKQAHKISGEAMEALEAAIADAIAALAPLTSQSSPVPAKPVTLAAAAEDDAAEPGACAPTVVMLPPESEVLDLVDEASAEPDDGPVIAEDGAPSADEVKAEPELERELEPEPEPEPEIEQYLERESGPDLEPEAEAEPSVQRELVMQSAPDTSDPAPSAKSFVDWDGWVRLALSEDRLGLAVHLARARELAGADTRESWPSDLLEGLIFGLSVEAANDRAAGRYEELSDRLIAIASAIDVSTSNGFGQALGLISGALRPCLVANYAGITVLDGLATGRELTEYHDLLELLREGPQHGLAAIVDLTPAAEQSQLDAQRALTLESLESWYRAVQTRTMPYQPATALWQRFMRSDGKIGAVFELAIAGHKGAHEQVQALAEELREDPEDFLDSHFEEFVGGGRPGLEGTARARFLALLSEARDLLETWLRIGAPPRSGPDRFDRFRTQLRPALKRAMAATADLIATGGTDVRMGAAMLARALEPFEQQLAGVAVPLSDPRQLLDTEIALLPEFPLNGRLGLEVAIDDVVPLQSAAAQLTDRLPDWTEAFNRALEVAAPGTARRIQPFLPEPLRIEATTRIDAVIVEQRRALAQRRRELRTLLDDYLSATVGDAVTEYEAQLQGLENFDLDKLPCEGLDEAGAIGDFPVLAGRLEQFAQRLNASRAAVAGELLRRIEVIEKDGADLADCRSLLERGNLGTLAEELTQIERFGPDRRRADPQSLIDPVTYFAREVLPQDPKIPAVQIQSLRNAATHGTNCGPFHFDRLPDSERASAKELLDAWATLKRAVVGAAADRNKALIGFLGALGFSNVKITREVPWRGGRQFEVRVDPLRSAGDCIIPAFGSQAQGAYSILLMPHGSLERSVESGFSELQPPVIVLAMEWLPERARREFLRKARGRPGAAFALLDDAAAAALAATPDRNLRSFFSLAVPLGAARPYSDNSAATSLEMFFGRDREYELLVDPQGSCLVYGGRQLGKTALLKQIELRNLGNPDFLVVYRDIKNVGAVDLPTSVWDRIGDALREKELAAPDACRGDRILETIKGWLRVQPKRRLLILLDEADNFLESEMEFDFPNIMKMKGLMEETGRRAKFVYAGLHNVQRFVRAPNSPILHLGEPVNIGPLLGDDRHAARQMVFEPMAAVGVGFQEPTDAHHMLSLVGYYPSLLQTFGKSLLATVDKRASQNGDPKNMPVLLDRSAIEAGFNAAAFRNELREKFRATLELDPRYELIAYAVCHKAEEERARGQIAGHGYSNREIYKLAQAYWPQGFTDIRSSETFGAILDEMVGLGVLARHGEGYAIRSARIAAMLGDSDQVVTHLLEFSDRERPTKPDPLANHRELDNGGYSALSWRTEKALVDQLRTEKNPVSLVFLAGSVAMGSTDNLVFGLKSLAEMQEWPQVRELDLRNIEELQRVISASRKEALPGKPKLIVCQGRWPTPGEVAALDGSKELRDAAHPVRVVFIGSAYDQVCGRASVEACRMIKATLIDLVPWDKEAVHLWLHRHARHCSDDPAFVAQVLEATGGFPLAFEQDKLPKASSDGAEAVLDRLRETANRVLNSATIGLDQPGLYPLAKRLYEFDDVKGLTEGDIIDLMDEHEDVETAFTALRNMGLLTQVQTTGEAHWRLLAKARSIIAGTQ